MNSELRMERYVALWMAAVLLFPYFPSLFPGYLGNNLAFIFSISLPLLYLFIQKGRFSWSGVKLPAIVLFYFLFSIIVASFHDAISVRQVSGSDLLVELIRPLVIFAVFMLWASFFNKDGLRDIWYADAYLFMGLAMAALCFFEVYGGRLAESFMYLMYKRDYKEIIFDKATGTFGITYYLAFFLLFPFIYSFCKFLLSFNLRYLTAAVLIMGAAFISQSRTAFFVYLISTFLSVLLVSLFTGRRGMLLGLMLVPLSLFGLSYFYLNMDSLLVNFTYLNTGVQFVVNGRLDLSGQETGSANVRIAQVYYVFDNMKWFGLIGSGMAKDGAILLESVYAMYLFRYGIIGLAVFFLILCFCFSSSMKKIRLARHAGDRDRVALYIACTCFFSVVPIALFSSAMQDAPKISLFYYGLVALCLVSKPDFTKERIV